MNNVIKYVLDIDDHLMTIDTILDNYLPPCDRDFLRFDRGSRYPVEKAHKSRCKLLKPNSYYPWIGVAAVIESLNMLIYRFIDNNVFKRNILLDNGGKNFCPDVDKEIEEIFSNRFPNLYVDDYEYIYNIIMVIYNNRIKPFTSVSTKNIWVVEEKPTNILLVDYGNIFEYRYNELRYEKEPYDIQRGFTYG